MCTDERPQDTHKGEQSESGRDPRVRAGAADSASATKYRYPTPQERALTGLQTTVVGAEVNISFSALSLNLGHPGLPLPAQCTAHDSPKSAFQAILNLNALIPSTIVGRFIGNS